MYCCTKGKQKATPRISSRVSFRRSPPLEQNNCIFLCYGAATGGAETKERGVPQARFLCYLIGDGEEGQIDPRRGRYGGKKLSWESNPAVVVLLSHHRERAPQQ